MNRAQLSLKQQKNLIWIVRGLIFITITAIALVIYWLGEAITLSFAIWLISLLVLFIAVEYQYARIQNHLKQTESINRKNQYLVQQQEALILLKSRMVAYLNLEDICKFSLIELRSSFGYPQSEIYLLDENSGRLMRVMLEDTHAPTQPVKLVKEKDRQASQAIRAQTENKGVVKQPALRHQVTALIKVTDKTYGRIVAEIEHDPEQVDIDRAIIHAVAETTALAITNAQNYEQQRSQRSEAEERESELRQRERDLTLLTEMTRATMKSQDLNAMLQTFADYLVRLFQADSSLITLWDEVRQQPIPIAAQGPLRQVIRTLQIEPGDLPLTASVLNSGQAITLENVKDSAYLSNRISAILQSQSLFALPLIVDDQKLGAAILTYRQHHVFSEHETSLGNQVAGLIALTIAKTRALETSQYRAQQLTALQKATAALLTTLDLENLLGQILDAAISAVPVAEKGRLLLIARDTGQLQIRAVQGYTDPRIGTFRPTEIGSYAARAVRERRPLIIHDAHADPDSPYKDDIPEVRAITSMIIAPLILGEETLGAISLDAYTRYAFTRSDLHLLVSFAATATAAIQNAQLHSEVQKQAITDALTGLYNRRGFFELGWREVERAHRFRRSLSALILDVDYFKDVNDTHGHLIGDQVLAGIATQFLRDLRQIDLVGRYGGDEFIALLPETDLENACLAGERLRGNVQESIFARGTEPVKITISVGAAALQEDGDTLEAMIERADQALYKAKEGGRNRVESES